MRYRIIILIVGLLLIPAAANAQESSITLDRNAPHKRALKHALHTAAKHVPMPRGYIHVRHTFPGERCGVVRRFSGCALFPGNMITLNARGARKHYIKFVLVHELAHFYDFRHLSYEDRRILQTWMPRGTVKRDDWIAEHARYDRRPREVFADYYTYCALYQTKRRRPVAPVADFTRLNKRERIGLRKVCRFLTVRI